MIVVDASALADFLLGRQEAVTAIVEALAGREQQALHAPELVEPEILNALRRMALQRLITEGQAATALDHLGRARLVRYPHAPLRARVCQLRHDLTAYDASYLALAEVLADGTLITGDRGLADRATTSLGAARVRHIA